MPNLLEYYQPPVTSKEQIKLNTTEGKVFKLEIENMDVCSLPGFVLVHGSRIVYPIPSLSGVYFFLFNKTPVYIGQSCCLHRRLHDRHDVLSLLKKINLDFELRWWLLPRNKRLIAERFLNRRFKPMFDRRNLYGVTTKAIFDELKTLGGDKQ